MKTVNETVVETTEQRLDARIESYMNSYPRLGYGTYLVRKEQVLPDRWVATFSRQSSCD